MTVFPETPQRSYRRHNLPSLALRVLPRAVLVVLGTLAGSLLFRADSEIYPDLLSSRHGLSLHYGSTFQTLRLPRDEFGDYALSPPHIFMIRARRHDAHGVPANRLWWWLLGGENRQEILGLLHLDSTAITLRAYRRKPLAEPCEKPSVERYRGNQAEASSKTLPRVLDLMVKVEVSAISTAIDVSPRRSATSTRPPSGSTSSSVTMIALRVGLVPHEFLEVLVLGAATPGRAFFGWCRGSLRFRLLLRWQRRV